MEIVELKAQIVGKSDTRFRCAGYYQISVTHRAAMEMENQKTPMSR